MGAVLWLAAAVLLAIAEIFAGELVLLMLAGGALAAAGATALLDLQPWVGAVVFAVVSVLLLLGVRPVAKRHMLSRPPVPSNTEALEGRRAVVTELVDHRDGRIKLAGEVWSARTLEHEDVIEPGTEVTVVEIDGATAVIWRA